MWSGISWRRVPVHESGSATADGGPGASVPVHSAACALLSVSRSGLYYRPKAASEKDLSLIGEIDRRYLETLFYGSKRKKPWLERRGIQVSRKRLMRAMGLRAIYRRSRYCPRQSPPPPPRAC